ncbi:helix-turn-helix domain-containing protein [Devosia sp.]|uniref:helix-turn-helix domain-containing protein n=1 Tax=Devosia sp. TaxID=1871048 RepID=UPI002FCC95A4
MAFTGDDMQRIRHQLGLSTLELGRAFGYEGGDDTVRVTIRRYESGQRPIPPWLGRLMTMFERFGVPKDFRDTDALMKTLYEQIDDIENGREPGD